MWLAADKPKMACLALSKTWRVLQLFSPAKRNEKLRSVCRLFSRWAREEPDDKFESAAQRHLNYVRKIVLMQVFASGAIVVEL